MLNYNNVEKKLFELFKQYINFINYSLADTTSQSLYTQNDYKSDNINVLLCDFTGNILIPNFKIIYLNWLNFINKLLLNNINVIDCFTFLNLLFNTNLYSIIFSVYNQNKLQLSNDEKMIHYFLIEIEIIKINKLQKYNDIKLLNNDIKLLNNDIIYNIKYIYNNLSTNNNDNLLCISMVNNLLQDNKINL